MLKWDLNIWRDEPENNEVNRYTKKKDFGENEIYENRSSSTIFMILNKARTNTLVMDDRNRHTHKEINCMVCDTEDKEDIYHCMLHCTAYTYNDHNRK